MKKNFLLLIAVLALLFIGSCEREMFVNTDFIYVQSEQVTEGYIMDMAIHENSIYTIVQSDDGDDDVMLRTDLASGKRMATWKIGKEYVRAIDSDGSYLYVLSRSNDNFIRKFDFSGNLVDRYPSTNAPSGKLYGLAAGPSAFYMTISDDSNSTIYSYSTDNDTFSRKAVVKSKIWSLAYNQKRLYAYQRYTTDYADNWLYTFDTNDFSYTRRHFLNGYAFGLDYHDNKLCVLNRKNNGFLVYSTKLDGNVIEGKYLARHVEAGFLYENSTTNAFNMDLWIGNGKNSFKQEMINLESTPPAEEVTDLFGNSWFYTRWENRTASVFATISFDTIVPERAYTLDANYVFSAADIPSDIYDLYTKETYCFDYNNEIFSNILSQINLSGSYIQNIIAIKNFVNDTLMVKGPSGNHSRASLIYDIIKNPNREGRCYYHTLLFAAIARKAGYPVRAIAGIFITESHDEDNPDVRSWDQFNYPSDSKVHTWNQFYFPDIGWVDIDTVMDDDDSQGNHSNSYVGLQNGNYYITFEGNYDLFDGETIFAQRSFIDRRLWNSIDSTNKANVGSGKRGAIVEPIVFESR